MKPITNNLCYACQESQLGWLLMAATSRGVCTIALGDCPHQLLASFQQKYPYAQAAPSDHPLLNWLSIVQQLLMPSIGSTCPTFPVDIQGTAFQKTVWQEIQKIPIGSTVSYTELARRIGNPKAIRAVARACASNSLAIVIPCHRVIGSNSQLTGYKWGIWRKQKLLDLELVIEVAAQN